MTSGDGETLTVADAQLLFNADFSRAGNDLVLTGDDGATLVIEGYFSSGSAPHLMSPEGALLTADVVAALAGPLAPGQYAQAGAPDGAEPIGQVETLTGVATATRANGVTVQLNVGNPVFRNDVIETASGSTLGITFLDETVFSLSEGSRMILNELVYQPGGSSNSMLFNLIQGTFSFVAGKVAPTGDMKIDTPVATMGIRGTWPVTKILAESGATDFSVVEEPDGTVGCYDVLHKLTKVVIGNVCDADTKLVMASITSTPLAVQKNLTDITFEQTVTQELTQTFNQWQSRAQEGKSPVDNSGNGQQQQQQQQEQQQQQPDQRGDIDGSTDQVITGTVQQGEVLGSGIQAAVTVADTSLTPTNITSTTPTNPNPPAGSGGTGGPGGTSGAGGTTTGSSGTTTEPPVTNDPPPPVPPAGTAPSITAPANLPATPEDSPVVLTGFNVTDDSAGPLTANLNTNAQSTVTLAQTTGLTFTVGDGVADEVMEFTGSAADITAALNGLTFNPTPDAEADGVLSIAVGDGTQTTTESISIPIDPEPDPPTINTVSLALDENTTVAGTVISSDPDTGDTFVFALTGNGPDDALFSIDATSGALSFLAAPDFENPQDTGGAAANNIYEVEVQVTDSDGLTDTQSILVQVNDVNEGNSPPVITSGNTASVAENTTAVLQVTATDTEPVTFALSGNGADDGLFQIDGAGNLSFIAAPDFENPQGSGGNDYQVEVEVSDGVNTTTQTIDISVTDENDNAPVITSANTASVAENTTAVLQVTATDADTVGGPLTFALSGNGADDGLFQIDGAGNLSFLAAPDFENPQGSGGNDYQVEVEVSDGVNTTTQVIDVSVTNVNDDAPVITSPDTASIAENTTAVLQVTATDTEPVTFALSGNGADDGLFQIDGAGNLSFLAAPDFENPQGSGGNDYQVEVEVSDGVNTTTQTIDISVTDENDNAPVITSPNTASVAENTTAVLQVTATDADTVGGPLTFALSWQRRGRWAVPDRWCGELELPRGAGL